MTHYYGVGLQKHTYQNNRSIRTILFKQIYDIQKQHSEGGVLCKFIEIALRHGCSPVNLLHIFRTPFPRNAFGGLLLDIVKPFCKYLCILPLIQNIKLQQGKFMWKLNSHNLPNCLLNKISLIRNQAINNANQQKTNYTILQNYHWKYVCTESRLSTLEIQVDAKLKENIKSCCKQFQADLLDLV